MSLFLAFFLQYLPQFYWFDSLMLSPSPSHIHLVSSESHKTRFACLINILHNTCHSCANRTQIFHTILHLAIVCVSELYQTCCSGQTLDASRPSHLSNTVTISNMVVSSVQDILLLCLYNIQHVCFVQSHLRCDHNPLHSSSRTLHSMAMMHSERRPTNTTDYLLSTTSKPLALVIISQSTCIHVTSPPLT